MENPEYITEILVDPLLEGVKSISHFLLRELKRRNNPAGFVNLVQTCLEKEINQIEGDDVFELVKKSALGQILSLEHGIKMNLNKDNTVKCEFTQQIDKDSLMKHLQGIKELDQVFHELITYEPSKDLDQVINLLKKFLKTHPYPKDYPSSYQCTLLYAAATTNFLGAAEVLVNDFQCMIDLASGKDEATPALQAITYGNMAVYNFLVEKGADRTKTNLKGLNPVYYEKLHQLEKSSDNSFEQESLLKHGKNSRYKSYFSDGYQEFEKLKGEKMQQVIIGKEKSIQKQNILESHKKVQEKQRKSLDTFHLQIFEPYLADPVICYLKQFCDRFLEDEVEIAKNIITIKPVLQFKQNHSNLDIVVVSFFIDHLERIKEQIEAIAECFKIARDTQIFFCLEKEKAMEWTARFLNNESFTNSRRDLQQKLKEIVKVKIEDTLEDCKNKLDQALGNQLLGILREEIIDRETINAFKEECKKYKENNSLMKEVESFTILIAEKAY